MKYIFTNLFDLIQIMQLGQTIIYSINKKDNGRRREVGYRITWALQKGP